MGFDTSTIKRGGPGGSEAGFTLAESLIASVVLAVAAAAIVGPVLASRQQSGMAKTNSVAWSLARQLMEEIASKPFADPTDGNTMIGPEMPETSRDLFDNVDDYHGYSDATPNLKMMNGAGFSLPAGVEYTRTVKVEYRSSPAGPTVLSGDFALVTVTVTPTEGSAVQLLQLMTRIPLKR